MRKFFRYTLISLLLVLVSLTIYLIQIKIFHKTDDTIFYILQDAAFIPIQVLIVTIIFNELLALSERKQLRKKLYMMIGIFFSESGTELLKHLSVFDTNISVLKNSLIVETSWNDKNFNAAQKIVNNYNASVDPSMGDLENLKIFLLSKREFMLSLLGNPNLLEHSSFSDLLLAVFHLTEELSLRRNLSELSAVDAEHVANDMRRAYHLLLQEWVVYIKHLKSDYPYIFSLITRTNPFNEHALIEIK